ncbi:hypothetical protein L8106_06339 [Lyngbya sp. PCC 8106]|nr:hypothetical protein L8106_06339 [Lyngbya sp. PCC 8106]
MINQEQAMNYKNLHIGCLDQVFPGWINTDITPHIYVSKVPGLPWFLYKLKKISPERYQQYEKGIFRQIKYLNVSQKFPWSDDTFDNVYTSHMLEHLYPEEGLNCISEVFRVLKKGGVFRIVVPDLDLMIDNYNSNEPEPFLAEFFEATQRRDSNQHHWHYNEKLFHKILSEVGFSKVHRCEYKKGQILDVEKIDQRPESLFIEAIK